jgi:hypothetical protein
MSLVNCPECKAEVSKTATKCPHCGHRIKNPSRGFFGVIFKYAFILFNIIMFFWWWTYTGDATTIINQTTNDAAKAGGIIGGAIGAGVLFSIWVVGDFILGLFVLLTRPRD